MAIVERFKVDSIAKGRERWGNLFAGDALEDFLSCAWQYLVYVLKFGVFSITVIVLPAIASLFDVLSPVAAGFTTGASMLLAVPGLCKRYWNTKRSAAHSLGLVGREVRKLDISSPERMAASLGRIWLQRGR